MKLEGTASDGGKPPTRVLDTIIFLSIFLYTSIANDSTTTITINSGRLTISETGCATHSFIQMFVAAKQILLLAAHATLNLWSQLIIEMSRCSSARFNRQVQSTVLRSVLLPPVCWMTTWSGLIWLPNSGLFIISTGNCFNLVVVVVFVLVVVGLPLSTTIWSLFSCSSNLPASIPFYSIPMLLCHAIKPFPTATAAAMNRQSIIIEPWWVYELLLRERPSERQKTLIFI